VRLPFLSSLAAFAVVQRRVAERVLPVPFAFSLSNVLAVDPVRLQIKQTTGLLNFPIVIAIISASIVSLFLINSFNRFNIIKLRRRVLATNSTGPANGLREFFGRVFCDSKQPSEKIPQPGQLNNMSRRQNRAD
jgi:hypothetical protein